MIQYANLDNRIAAIISNKLATLNELQTVYSFEDMLNLYEVITIDNYNRYVLNKD